MCNESYCTTLQKERHNNRLCNVAAVFIFAGEVKNVFHTSRQWLIFVNHSKMNCLALLFSYRVPIFTTAE